MILKKNFRSVSLPKFLIKERDRPINEIISPLRDIRVVSKNLYPPSL
ncbi:MAG: hypothetical protein ABIK97_04920 [candidate division WOR-3 bacterium]